MLKPKSRNSSQGATYIEFIESPMHYIYGALHSNGGNATFEELDGLLVARGSKINTVKLRDLLEFMLENNLLIFKNDIYSIVKDVKIVKILNVLGRNKSRMTL